jgi:hypothetical protein
MALERMRDQMVGGGAPLSYGIKPLPAKWHGNAGSPLVGFNSLICRQEIRSKWGRDRRQSRLCRLAIFQKQFNVIGAASTGVLVHINAR